MNLYKKSQLPKYHGMYINEKQNWDGCIDFIIPTFFANRSGLDTFGYSIILVVHILIMLILCMIQPLSLIRLILHSRAATENYNDFWLIHRSPIFKELGWFSL